MTLLRARSDPALKKSRGKVISKTNKIEISDCSAAGLDLQIASELESIKALQDEWAELERHTPEATGFQSFWWCFGWLEASCCFEHGSLKPIVIILREGGRLVWLLPIQVEKSYGIRWARALGGPVTQYADALAIPSPRRRIWRAASDEALRSIGEIDVVSMVQVRVDSVLAKTSDYRNVRPASSGAPFINLTDAAAVSRSLVLRGSLRRRQRLLARTAQVSFEVTASPGERLAALHDALELKIEWLRSRHLYRLSFATPIARRFLERLTATGRVEVYSLKVGTHRAAFDIGFIDRSTYRSLLSAYDLIYAYGSPGHQLTRAVIDYCRSRGLHQLDLFAPAEAYKQEIASGSIDIVSLHEDLTKLGRAGMFASLKLRGPFYTFREWCDRFRNARRRFTRTFFRRGRSKMRPTRVITD